MTLVFLLLGSWYVLGVLSAMFGDYVFDRRDVTLKRIITDNLYCGFYGFIVFIVLLQLIHQKGGKRFPRLAIFLKNVWEKPIIKLKKEEDSDE